MNETSRKISVGPDALGHAAPVGDVVQGDVVAALAEAGGEIFYGHAEIGEPFPEGGELKVIVGAFDEAALAWHGDAVAAGVTPTDADSEIACGGVQLAAAG